MSALPASPDQDEQLAGRMRELGISEADFQESFVRSGGHGGQNVNKTSTCVMLVHKPSGLQVKCQESRHQGINRLRARRLLLDKIESFRKARVEAERSRAEKIRRQKRPRSRGSKQRTLADKARQAAKKRLRGRPTLD
jgi:protein subunit release factor B